MIKLGGWSCCTPRWGGHAPGRDFNKRSIGTNSLNFFSKDPLSVHSPNREIHCVIFDVTVTSTLIQSIYVSPQGTFTEGMGLHHIRIFHAGLEAVKL